MSLVSNLQNLTTRVATEIKAVRALTGDLSSLSTEQKSSVVNAINELKVALDTVVAEAGGVIIVDGETGASSTWSSLKVSSEIGAVADSVNQLIDDSNSNTTNTYSSQKINDTVAALYDAIDEAINGVTNGAPAALDTLDELAAALGDDANFAAGVTAALANRLRVDTAAQGLTLTQKANARTNIDVYSMSEIGNPETNFVTTFNAGLI